MFALPYFCGILAPLDEPCEVYVEKKPLQVLLKISLCTKVGTTDFLSPYLTKITQHLYHNPILNNLTGNHLNFSIK